MKIKGYIGIYSIDGERRVQPTLYDTFDEAMKGLNDTCGNYLGRLKYAGVIPIGIKHDIEPDGEDTRI